MSCFKWAGVTRRLSTWLSVIATVAAAAATAGLVAYATFPQRVQDLMPDWLLIAMGGTAMVATVLIPVATSLKQKSLSRSRRRKRQSKKKPEADQPAADEEPA